MMDRARLLHEMGLGPLWKLRQRPVSAEAVGEPSIAQDSAPSAASASPPARSSQSAAGLSTAPTVDAVAADWSALEVMVAACRQCRLSAERKQPVFGVGDRRAEWLFVGEGPGAEEDEKGEPFVGQAGHLLDNMLAAIGLRRGENVYIANAVKCRPPHNRTPEAEEIAACRPFLERQIALIQPRLIVALGRPAAQSLLQAEVKIAAARGHLHRYQDIPLIVTYHPAYLLRNLADKARAWEDLCFMVRTMKTLRGQS